MHLLLMFLSFSSQILQNVLCGINAVISLNAILLSILQGAYEKNQLKINQASISIQVEILAKAQDANFSVKVPSPFAWALLWLSFGNLC